MGNANCNVANDSAVDFGVITFNNADKVYKYFNTRYNVFTQENVRVEAAADAWGLQVGVVYSIEGNNLYYQRYFCRHTATLRVTSLEKNGRISATGCDRQGIGNISAGADVINDMANTFKWYVTEVTVPIAKEVIPALVPVIGKGMTSSLADWTVCTDSYECINQCCSGKYSSGVIKCTPVGGFKPWEGCVGSGTAPKLGDWEVCDNSNQCSNQCCSGKYSSGVLKCTPVGGFKSGEGCTGSATRHLRGGGDAEEGLVSAAGDKSTAFEKHGAVEDLVWDSMEYEAAAEDVHGAVLN